MKYLKLLYIKFLKMLDKKFQDGIMKSIKSLENSERILFLTFALMKEIEQQGFSLKGNGDCKYFVVFEHSDAVHIDSNDGCSLKIKKENVNGN